jgi:hypothetical protein
MFARRHLNSKKLSMPVSACYCSCDGKHKIGDSWSKLAWTKKKMRPYLQNNQRKKDEGVAQAVERILTSTKP